MKTAKQINKSTKLKQNILSPVNLDLDSKLKSKVYRHHYYKCKTEYEIANQIRELRKLRNLTQLQLAELCKTKQPVISRYEKTYYTGRNFNSLFRIADALDVRIKITLEPMEKVLELKNYK